MNFGISARSNGVATAAVLRGAHQARRGIEVQKQENTARTNQADGPKPAKKFVGTVDMGNVDLGVYTDIAKRRALAAFSTGLSNVARETLGGFYALADSLTKGTGHGVDWIG